MLGEGSVRGDARLLLFIFRSHRRRRRRRRHPRRRYFPFRGFRTLGYTSHGRTPLGLESSLEVEMLEDLQRNVFHRERGAVFPVGVQNPVSFPEGESGARGWKNLAQRTSPLGK